MYFTFQIGFSKVDVGEIFLLGSKADKAFFAGLKKKKKERDLVAILDKLIFKLR